MKNISDNKNVTITISEETQAMIMAIASLDKVFNFASQRAEEEDGVHGSDYIKIKSCYMGMRGALVGLLAQGISRNLCPDATCI